MARFNRGNRRANRNKSSRSSNNAGGADNRARYLAQSRTTPKKTTIQKVNSGNARDDYRANQGYRAQQKSAFEQQQAEMNRGSIQRMANKGVINRSDFKDGAARLKGESPQDYAKFMQGLHKSNPAAMQKAFPFSSGAMVGKLANLIPGMGALKGIAGLLNKGKNKAQSAGSGIKDAFLDEFSGTGS